MSARDVEVIGPPECPLLLRRTLVSTRWFKVLLHEFLPNAADRDEHDHPRGFFTFVYRGGYDDWSHDDDGEQWVDRMRAPAIRYRSATHAHTTLVHHDGCKSLVIMGRLRRPWGFIRDGRWYPVALYDRLFGHGSFRCP